MLTIVWTPTGTHGEEASPGMEDPVADPRIWSTRVLERHKVDLLRMYLLHQLQCLPLGMFTCRPFGTYVQTCRPCLV